MSPIPDLSAHTGFLMRMVSNAVSHEFARTLAGEGVTVAEWTMLRSLYGDEAVAPSVLAGRMGMTKGAISKLADRLTEKGLVERAGNPDDRRGHRLSLSAAGMQKIPVLAALADKNDAAFFAVLGADEQARLRQLLGALIGRHGLSKMPID